MANGIVRLRPKVAIKGDVYNTLWAHKTSLRLVPNGGTSKEVQYLESKEVIAHIYLQGRGSVHLLTRSVMQRACFEYEIACCRILLPALMLMEISSLQIGIGKKIVWVTGSL